MASVLAWIDHDPAEQERMQRILALLQVRDTRDELGVGAIRDSFADQLFPGTSTIQTRLRYMLFVPWIYQGLEAGRVPSARAAVEARRRELALSEVLAASGDEGVFGRTAGQSLKRVPSSVYWAGLEAWGIRRFHGSQEQYHRALDEIYSQRAFAARRDDGEAGWEASTDTWHAGIPACPSDFPFNADFTLSEVEADYMRERIATTQPDSLLAYLAVHGRPAEVPFAWLHPDQNSFPDAARELLHHARLFSEVMKGAAILYNALLADHAERAVLAGEHWHGLAAWAEALDHDAVLVWDLERLWDLTARTSHTISIRARTFVEAWVKLVRANPEGLGGSDDARLLIQRREGALKGGRSRFANRGVLAQWSGRAGMEPLSYRWPTVQRFLKDLHLSTGGARA